MRTLLALLMAVMLVGALGAQTPAPKKAAPGAAKKAKKEEPPPKIEGQEIARKDGGFMGLLVADGKFKLSFYDKEKKPVPPDVGSAVLRWTPNYKSGDERVLLTPGGENILTSERVIRPPYNFKLLMTLLRDAAAAETPETYVVDFRQ